MKAIHKILWRIGAGCGAALLAAGCTTNEMHMEVSYDQLQFGAQDNVARYVNVAADGAWSCEVVPEAQQWLTAVRTGEKGVLVRIKGNDGEQMRCGTIQLRTTEVDAEPCLIRVYQLSWAQDKLAVEFDGGELTANVGPEAGEETYFRINSSFVSGFYQVYTATVAHATFEEAVPVSWLRVEQVNADESLWRLQTTEANRSAVAREGFVVLYCTYKVDNRSATVICSARVQQAAAAQ